MRRVSKLEALAALDEERARMNVRAGECAMCVLARPDWERALIVAENETGVLRVNRIPSRPNEMMVVLRAHRERVFEVPAEDYVRLFALAHRAGSLLEQRFGAIRVFIAQLGAPEDLRVSYPHLHVHVLPLYEGGEEARPSRVFSWSECVYVYDEGEAEAAAELLRRAL